MNEGHECSDWYYCKKEWQERITSFKSGSRRHPGKALTSLALAPLKPFAIHSDILVSPDRHPFWGGPVQPQLVA